MFLNLFLRHFPCFLCSNVQIYCTLEFNRLYWEGIFTTYIVYKKYECILVHLKFDDICDAMIGKVTFFPFFEIKQFG